MISYCLRTNYAKVRELHETIKSILKQQGDKEIIVCGIMPDTDKYFNEVRFFDMKQYADTGYTSIMRDKGFAEAKGEFIVAMDDDILLHDVFQEAIGSEDIQIPSCLNFPFGGRFWDWCVLNHPELGQSKIPYDTPYSQYNYLSGQCFIIKSEVAKQVQHDQDLKFHQADDVDYGVRLQKQGFIFTMNEKAICTHFDARYRSINNDRGVAKYG
jgi:GT2 family glycosyltransferase